MTPAQIDGRRRKGRAPPGMIEGKALRRQKALDLRCSGAGYRQIGQQLSVSHVQAYRDVHDALAEVAVLQKRTAEKLRDLERSRLDQMQLALWPAVQAGDVLAVRAVVAIMDRRAKLLGLDAPEKRELSGPDGKPLRVLFGGRYRQDHADIDTVAR